MAEAPQTDESAGGAAGEDAVTDGERARAERVNDLRAKGFPRSLRTLYAVMIACIGLQAALHLWTFLIEAVLADDALELPDAPTAFVTHAYRAAFWVFALAIPIGCVAWMRWLDWSVKNRIVESAGRFGRTPAGVVWAYFIPVINLFRPFFDLRRLYVAETRRGREPPGVLLAWWLVTLAHLGLMVFDLRPGITALTAASSALGVLSNALALTVLFSFRRVQAHALGTASAAPVQPAPDEPPAEGATA